ncbi:MAG: hypothetical protein AAF333_04830 [Planctomycetota bacterium]
MLDFLKLLFDWKDLFNIAGLDAVVYAGMALVGTALFAIRLAFALLLGIDGDLDLDVEDIDHGAGFGMVSIFSITAFLMGSGWAGLAAQLEWQLGNGWSAAVAGGFGTFLMVLASTGMFAAKKLTREVTYDTQTAAGKIGTAYRAIPAKGEGSGEVRVSISGRSMVVSAISAGPAIAAFADVKVVEVRDDQTLVVEPV